MRSIRLALPLFLILGGGPAEGAQSLHPLPAPPPPVPAPPAPPRPPWPPELIPAWRAASEAEALVARGRLDEALALFRPAVLATPPGRQAYLLSSLHLRMLAHALIRAGRQGDADRELAWLIERAPAGADPVLRLNDLRLYIHAGRGDIEQVLALLDARFVFAGTPAGYCPALAFFPEVVAPAQHDPRVAAKLRALGCDDTIIAQLDELASRPIGATSFDRGLPPREAPQPR
jgi:tetratricopeptide (TPR) repeat protein